MPYRRLDMPEALNPGELVHDIIIEQPGDTRRTSGSFDRTWPAFATARCSMESGTGSESFGADLVVALAYQKFEMRYIPGITTAMRINLHGRYFDIKDINNVRERNRKLILTCVEGLGSGN